MGGDYKNAASLFSKQCLITIGYNFVPIPGAMGISDYLMLDGYSRIMSSDMAYKIEMIGRGITFYICVLICGIITLAGYLIGKKKADIVHAGYNYKAEKQKRKKIWHTD